MKRATLTLFLVLLLVLALLGLNTTAQDTAGQDTAGSGSAPAETEEELESFVPTEKLPADTAISFPVDI